MVGTTEELGQIILLQEKKKINPARCYSALQAAHLQKGTEHLLNPWKRINQQTKLRPDKYVIDARME